MPTLNLIGTIGNEITVRAVRDELAAMGDVREIDVFLHSDGGDIPEGFAIYDELLSHPARVVVRIPGLAASMATIVAMAADDIRIAENAFFVVHNPFVQQFGGESEDLRRVADLLDAFKSFGIRAYRRHSPLSDAELSELMDAESWLTAQDAVASGFAHAVTGRVEAVNRLDLSRLDRVPKAARAFLTQGVPMPKETKEKPAVPASAPATALPAAPPTTPPEDAPSAPPSSPVGSMTVENFLQRLGQFFRRNDGAAESPNADSPVLTTEETAAVMRLERDALRGDRARLHLDRDLGPHRGRIEPAQLENLEPILLKLKTAELGGDAGAGAQYNTLTALLPSLASDKAGGELAGSDDAALTASMEVSETRLAVERRRGITDERRQELMHKYPGCRPDAV